MPTKQKNPGAQGNKSKDMQNGKNKGEAKVAGQSSPGMEPSGSGPGSSSGSKGNGRSTK